MTTPVSDKIFLGVGGLLFAGACAWAFMQQAQLAKLEGQINVPLTGAAYTPASLPAATISEALQWPVATALSRGPNWVYDVFTPPVIYYNEEDKQFTVTPPEARTVAVEVVAPPEPFGVSLLKVVQYPFPLQLVGYVGKDAEIRGTFQNELTQETFFGTTGKQIPALNMEIVNFTAKRVRKVVEGQTIVYTEASARVRDLKTGKETDLSNTKRLIEADPVVVIQVDGEANTRELSAGASFTVGELTYTIDSIQTDPASVTITKSGGDLAEPKTENVVEGAAKLVTPQAPAEPSSSDVAPATTEEAIFGF